MKVLTPEQQVEIDAGMRETMRVARKAIGKRRYLRRYARHAVPPLTVKQVDPTAEMLRRARWLRFREMVVIRGLLGYLQQVVRSIYGPPGTWGHGKHAHGTAKGPGLRPLPRKYRLKDDGPLLDRTHPARTKLVRQIIRRAGGEQTAMRRLYARLTGKHYQIGA